MLGVLMLVAVAGTGRRGHARRLGDGRRPRLRFPTDRDLDSRRQDRLREARAADVAARLRSDQGPQVRADARHPQPARRRRRAVGRRPAHRHAAGPVGCVQPRLRPQRGSGCIYPESRAVGGPTGRPSCVNATNATILRDGILPSGVDPGNGRITSWGQDAQHNRQFTRAGTRSRDRPAPSSVPSARASSTSASASPGRPSTSGATTPSRPGRCRSTPCWTCSRTGASTP